MATNYFATATSHPTGNNSNPGTLSQPWLDPSGKTPADGDIWNFANGVYPLTDSIYPQGSLTINNSGLNGSGAAISIFSVQIFNGPNSSASIDFVNTNPNSTLTINTISFTCDPDTVNTFCQNSSNTTQTITLNNAMVVGAADVFLCPGPINISNNSVVVGSWDIIRRSNVVTCNNSVIIGFAYQATFQPRIFNGCGNGSVFNNTTGVVLGSGVIPIQLLIASLNTITFNSCALRAMSTGTGYLNSAVLSGTASLVFNNTEWDLTSALNTGSGTIANNVTGALPPPTPIAYLPDITLLPASGRVVTIQLNPNINGVAVPFFMVSPVCKQNGVVASLDSEPLGSTGWNLTGNTLTIQYASAAISDTFDVQVTGVLPNGTVVQRTYHANAYSPLPAVTLATGTFTGAMVNGSGTITNGNQIVAAGGQTVLIESSVDNLSHECTVTSVTGSGPWTLNVGLDQFGQPVNANSGDAWTVPVGAGSGGATAAQVWGYTPRTLTSSGSVVVVSPVTQNLDLQLTPGDAYDSTTGQPVTFTDPGTWPSLSTVSCTVAPSSAPEVILFTVNCTVAAGPPQVVSVPFTSAETLMLRPGDSYLYQIRANFGASENRTLITGNITALPSMFT